MNNTEKYYKSFGLDRSIPRSFLKKQELNQLFAIPKKETPKLAAHIYNFEEDNTHQADILFLPHDKVGKKTYAYALIVVDVATGDTDGEALLLHEGWNGPTSEDVSNAIVKIYNRKILTKPKLLVTDSGQEFLGEEFQDFLGKNAIGWKKAVGGRHRQVGLVERRNYTIGRAIMMRQHAESMITQKETRHWVKYFPDLMKAVNTRFSHEPLDDKDLYKKYGDPWKEEQKILPIGTRVRIQLMEPKDYKERGIKGHFRAGDLRYGQDIFKIVGFHFDPHAPVLYKLNQKLKKNEHIAYTRRQLQVVKENEMDVSAKELGVKIPDDGEFAIKKLIDKRTRGNRTEYKVFWRGYSITDATWLYKSKIPKSFVEAYEEDNP
jgi:hypothetical protein